MVWGQAIEGTNNLALVFPRPCSIDRLVFVDFGTTDLTGVPSFLISTYIYYLLC